MDFTQNYFQLLSIPQQYTVDNTLLSDCYRQLQKQFHPDKFASKPANEQRLAVQFAAYINTAYQTLQSSILRAEYLLLLADEEVNHQSTTISDGQFLMLQMQWRESLADIVALEDLSMAEDQLDRLGVVVKQEVIDLELSFEQQYSAQDMAEAKKTVAKLHFVTKMLSEIDSAYS
ncbi:MAG: molecular chaperone HscB [Kiritimatiellia bacterium]|jgi:molecular chaperone HscB